MQDLTQKWAKDCKKVEDVVELIATEQLLEALPTNVRIWVRERKPKTATEAGQLADDYVQAWRQENKVSAEVGKGGEPTRSQVGARPKCDNCGKMVTAHESAGEDQRDPVDLESRVGLGLEQTRRDSRT